MSNKELVLVWILGGWFLTILDRWFYFERTGKEYEPAVSVVSVIITLIGLYYFGS